MGNSQDLDRLFAQMDEQTRNTIEKGREAGISRAQEPRDQGLQKSGQTPNDKELGVPEYVTRDDGSYHRREDPRTMNEQQQDLEPER